MKRVILPAAVLACLCAVVWLNAVRRHSPNSAGEFDYYLLSLSWAPNYCAAHPNDHSIECRVGQRAGFVLHGLWPQSNAGRAENCAPASPVSDEMVRHMLQYLPSRGLIQHEWAAHGVCTGLSAQEYFGKLEQAYTAIKVPDPYRALEQSRSLRVQEIERSFAAANGAPAGAFRVSCHAGELVGVEACLDKELRYQACTAGARDCPAPQVWMRPVR